MAGVKISALPAVASALLTDFFPVVQGGVTSQETLLQVATLFGFDSTTHLLSLSKGGTNANLTAALGAIPYSTASAFAFLAPGTSGQLFQSGGAGAPIWTTATYPTTASTSGKVIVSDGTNFSSSFTTGITALGAQAQALNMNTHLINNVVNPVSAQDAATKAYVDSFVQGFTFQDACRVATTTALTVTYNNGTAGVGATLTNAGAFAALAIDGVTLAVGDRVLVKDQASTLQNGIYTATVLGDGVSVNWVMTRATDYDQVAEIQPGDLVVITAGTSNANSSWLQTATVTAVGTDPITFTQFSAALPITVPNGGTGRTTSTTAYGLIAAGTTATGALQTLATGSAGQVLQSAGNAALPAYSTATYPSTAGTSGKILISDGTNIVSSTATYPSTGGTAGTFLKSDGTNWINSTNKPITSVVTQVFTGNGTYTPTSGMVYCVIECLGGGGGGGGQVNSGVGQALGASGGGSGSYSRKTSTAATIGASQTVTIGAGGTAGANTGTNGGNGGDTSVGAICIGKGGSGGPAAGAVGGAGGVAGTGDVTLIGNAGFGGPSNSTNLVTPVIGAGAGSIFGGAPTPRVFFASAAGDNASLYGAGGSGGTSWNAGGAAAGGTGSAGIAIVTEYVAGG